MSHEKSLGTIEHPCRRGGPPREKKKRTGSFITPKKPWCSDLRELTSPGPHGTPAGRVWKAHHWVWVRNSSFSKEKLQKAWVPVFPVEPRPHSTAAPNSNFKGGSVARECLPLRPVCHRKDPPWPPPQSQTWPDQQEASLYLAQCIDFSNGYFKYVQRSFSYSRIYSHYNTLLRSQPPGVAAKTNWVFFKCCNKWR